MKHVCFLSLGSNLNSRIENIEQAIVRLSNNYTVLKVSSFYETDAWGYEDDLKYINCVVKIETSVDVLSLLNGINLIEKQLGRDRKSKINYCRLEFFSTYFPSTIPSNKVSICGCEQGSRFSSCKRFCCET